MRTATIVLSILSLALTTLPSGSAGAQSPSLDPDAAAASGSLVPPVESLIVRNQLGYEFPPAPAVPDGPPDEALVTEIDALFDALPSVDVARLERIAAFEDPRTGWILSDMLRFLSPDDARTVGLDGFERLTGVRLSADPVSERSLWQSLTDHMLAWELPALPGYREWKAQLFLFIEPRWEPFFADADSDIDWRFISWGGVPMDARVFGDPRPCPRGCIPALDDPAVTDADGGDWYPDELPVFGVTVNGESRAYPRHIMEIHEMVNDELGGRRIGMPYCTLCGAAQVFFTDDVSGANGLPVLRTSGLLNRSNKVMFDLGTFSVFDTFFGEAVSGPLHDAGVTLEQASVVTSSWGEWKAAHPDTTIIAEDGGIGRRYPLDPLRGRDDDGPIFPIGDVDPRLPTQAKVLGVIAPDGTPIAFDVESARAELDAGRAVTALDIVVVADAAGVRATGPDGAEIAAHEAFWFAWSQFHADTEVWSAR